MTSTELAREILASGRLIGDDGSYFDELAAVHGRDVTGLAWIQACFAVADGPVEVETSDGTWEVITADGQSA